MSNTEMQPASEDGFFQTDRSRNFFYFFLNFWLIFAKIKSTDIFFAYQTSSVDVYDKVYYEKYRILFILSQN